MKFKKYLKRIVIVILVIAVVLFVFLKSEYKNYKKGRDSFFDRFYLPYSVQTNVDKMYDSIAQTVKIGDYEITLNRLIYDGGKQNGWCEFDVTRGGEIMLYDVGVKLEELRPRIDYIDKKLEYNVHVVNPFLGIASFGRKTQFSVQMGSDSVDGSYICGEDSWFEVPKDNPYTMNIYQYVSVENNNTYNHCLYLYNERSGKGSGVSESSQMIEDMSGVFVLYEEDTPINKYSYSRGDVKYDIYVSSDTINIRGEGKIDIKDINIKMNDGKDISVKKGGIFDSKLRNCGEYIPDEEIVDVIPYGGDYTLKTYTCVMESYTNIDVNEIAYVEVDGEKIEN